MFYVLFLGGLGQADTFLRVEAEVVTPADSAGDEVAEFLAQFGFGIFAALHFSAGLAADIAAHDAERNGQMLDSYGFVAPGSARFGADIVYSHTYQCTM